MRHAPSLLVTFLGALALGIPSCSAPGAPSPGLSSAAEQSVALPGNHPAGVDMKTARPAPPEMPLQMRLVFELRNKQELERLKAEQQDPSSPGYHRWLGTFDFASRFGPSADAVEEVAQWLTGAGFKVEAKNPGDLFLGFSGTVAQAESALGVRIMISADGQSYFNVGAPRIPSRFSAVVKAIDGLDNLRRAVPLPS